MKTTMKARVVMGSLALKAAIAFFAPALHAQTTVGFENLPVGSDIRNHLAPLGVRFPSGAWIDTLPRAHSGRNVLHTNLAEFNTSPLVITFSTPQLTVRFYAGANQPAGTVLSGIAKAYDQNGQLLVQDGVRPVDPSTCSTLFQLRTRGPTPAISRVELLIFRGTDPNATALTDIAIDDMVFEGTAPLPVETTPPVVVIASPTQDQHVDGQTVVIEGTVSGGGLPPSATVTIEAGMTPTPRVEQGPQTVQFLIPLSASANQHTKTFSVSNVQTFLGYQTINVDVQNDGGLDGSATVRILNLPQAILDRYTAEGGLATFGKLAEVLSSSRCKIAEFAKEAISWDGHSTYLIFGDVLTKWLQWGGGVDDSFCPVDEETFPGASFGVQNFVGGRIYLVTQGQAYYVPKVFAQAIDALGGEEATGLPISDPMRSVPVESWLFQQFQRRREPCSPTGQFCLSSTLEIKGTPPTLYVERQGGDLTDLTRYPNHLSGPLGSQIVDARHLVLWPGAATLWESFPCSGNEGPCTVTPAATTYSQRRNVCPGPAPTSGSSWTWVTPEWAPVIDDNTMIPLQGWVTKSDRAGDDFTGSHELSYNTELDGSPTAHVWSDWNLYVMPLKPYWNVYQWDTTFDNSVEVEFEYGRAAHMFALGWPPSERRDPKRGDLVFASGRWVRDCGHDPYTAEIHPPYLLAYMRTEYLPVDPSTVAYIWVNGWYLGAPVDVDLYPPPRPSPVDFLAIKKPHDSDAAVDVNVSFDWGPTYSSIVRVHFSSLSIRQAQVADASGRLTFQPGRGYEGEWVLSWRHQGEFQIERASSIWWP